MIADPKRRPIASRRWRISQCLAAWLAARRVPPNAISVAGMATGLLAGGCFAATSWMPKFAIWFWLLGVACIQLRLIANMLDGMVAMLTGKSSPVGELYNEAPDRVSDTAIFVGLGYAAGGEPTLGYAAALAAMFTACVRTTCVAAGAPPNFQGPMAKQHRMFVVTCLGIAAAFLPYGAALSRDGEWTLTRLSLGIVIAGSLLTAMRRLTSSARSLRR